MVSKTPYKDKVSQVCPKCRNRVLAIRINGFYSGSRDRIFLWECPLCECVWKKTRPRLKVVGTEVSIKD